jgi:ribosome biogenesis GTPase
VDLQTLGWSDFYKACFAEYGNQDYTVGRIITEHKNMYRLLSETGDYLSEISGKLRHEARERQDYPSVGDWVVITERPEEKRATIHAVLPRRTKFSRKVAGDKTTEQIVATNVDTVFLINAMNNDFNIRRIERYLTLAWESGSNPVIVLSKADLCDNVADKVREVESVALGVPIHVISSIKNEGIDSIIPYLKSGQTIALLGSSGAGKSTLINNLLGKEVQDIQEVREGDDRGRHTTTYRELFVIPTGGLIIDTPGMRELQLWDAEEGVQQGFSDIEKLAENCYFSNCQHKRERNCAIREALQNGSLNKERYENYLKIKRELAYQVRREDIGAFQEHKEMLKQRSQYLKNIKR